MKVNNTLKNLCRPAYIYFMISMVSFVAMVIQNRGNSNTYCVGPYECYVSNTSGVFLAKLMYILFFTWLLDVFCKAGYSSLSWFLVLLPFTLMFVMIAGFIIINAGHMVM